MGRSKGLRGSPGALVALRDGALAALVAGVGLLGLGTPGALAITWNLPASDLTEPEENAQFPEVAVAPGGATTIAWVGGDFSNRQIQAAGRPSGCR